MTRFSVLMPVYNCERYLRQAIDSVLAQSFRDFELIAVDDGSTDGSAGILSSYGARIRMLRQANRGAEVARNTAAAAAQGEYLAYFDGDDILFPHALQNYDRILRAFDSPPLVLGGYVNFHDGEALPGWEDKAGEIEVLRFADYLARTVRLPGMTSNIVVKKTAFDEVGGFRDSTPQTFHMDNMYLLMKLGTQGPCIIERRPAAVAYRLHEGNSIRNTKGYADGLARIAEAERAGAFPGGSERRMARYAVIGGRAWSWCIDQCMRKGEYWLGLRLFAATYPMIAAAIWNKVFHKLGRSQEHRIVLRTEELRAEEPVGPSADQRSQA